MLHIARREMFFIECLLQHRRWPAKLIRNAGSSRFWAENDRLSVHSVLVLRRHSLNAACRGVCERHCAVGLSPAWLDGRMNELNGGLRKGLVSAPRNLDQQPRTLICLCLALCFRR